MVRFLVVFGALCCLAGCSLVDSWLQKPAAKSARQVIELSPPVTATAPLEK